MCHSYYRFPDVCMCSPIVMTTMLSTPEPWMAQEMNTQHWVLYSFSMKESIVLGFSRRKDFDFLLPLSWVLLLALLCRHPRPLWCQSEFGSGTATTYFMTFGWNLLSLPGHRTTGVEMCFSEAWTRKTVQGYESHCISAVWWEDQGRGPCYGALAHLIAPILGLTWLPVYFFHCCPFSSHLILKLNRMAEIILIWLRQFFLAFSAVSKRDFYPNYNEVSLHTSQNGHHQKVCKE